MGEEIGRNCKKWREGEIEIRLYYVRKKIFSIKGNNYLISWRTLHPHIFISSLCFFRLYQREELSSLPQFKDKHIETQRGKVAYFQVPSKSKEYESPEHSLLVLQDSAGSQGQQRGFPAQSRFVGRSTKSWNSMLVSEERALRSIQHLPSEWARWQEPCQGSVPLVRSQAVPLNFIKWGK